MANDVMKTLLGKVAEEPADEAALAEGAAPTTETAPAPDSAATGPAPTQPAASAPATPDAPASPEDDDLLEDSEDSLTYSNGLIEKIVAMATREVPHVLGMKGNFFHAIQEQLGVESLSKGVTVEVTDDNRVVVNISVIIEYGCYAPDIFEGVKERVTERLTAITGLEVAGINLRIEDVVTPEEVPSAQ